MEMKGFISYNPQDILVTEGTQGRHLEAGTETETVKDCCLLSCSHQPASYATQTTTEPTHVHQDSVLQCSYGHLDGGIFSTDNVSAC